MIRFSLFLLVFLKLLSVGATEIPHEMEFAGMTLEFSESVRRALQSDVEMINKNQKYFLMKTDRAKLCFPLIDRVFRDEGLPEDFKFLALQESSLIPDAVSSSNAVGYWQFKKETAVEVGLRVDGEIDERMNLVASSKGAAAYLKKNNVTLNNWVYALLSYNLGLGGVKSKVEDKYIGTKKMEIDDNMHWYVIRFLAHKIAFQNSVSGPSSFPYVLFENRNCSGKTLKEISEDLKVDLELLKEYNKWLKCDRIPGDKVYSVIIPVPTNDKDIYLANHKSDNVPVKTVSKNTKNHTTEPRSHYQKDLSGILSVNKVKVIKAQEGDDIKKLALRAGISVEEFIFYNNLKNFEELTTGTLYFIQPKRSKAHIAKHTVQTGESLNEISQKYGVKVSSIRKKNRMDKSENLQSGRVLWLRKRRPKNTPVEYENGQPSKKVVEPVKPIENYDNKQSLSNSGEVKKQIEGVTIKETIKDIAYIPDTASFSTHTVSQGETIYFISKKYLTTTDSIMKWNNLNDYSLKIGQVLAVKKKEIKKEKKIEHKVMQGETLYKISKQYNVSVDKIQEWNNKTDNSVNIDEVLIIYIPDMP